MVWEMCTEKGTNWPAFYAQCARGEQEYADAHDYRPAQKRQCREDCLRRLSSKRRCGGAYCKCWNGHDSGIIDHTVLFRDNKTDQYVLVTQPYRYDPDKMDEFCRVNNVTVRRVYPPNTWNMYPGSWVIELVGE